MTKLTHKKITKDRILSLKRKLSNTKKYYRNKKNVSPEMKKEFENIIRIQEDNLRLMIYRQKSKH